MYKFGKRVECIPPLRIHPVGSVFLTMPRHKGTARSHILHIAKAAEGTPSAACFYYISFAVSVSALTAFRSINASTLKVTLGKPCLK